MKLASLKHGRDGRLAVVSHDLTRAADATHIARTMQAALDDWATAEPLLRDLALALEKREAPDFPFQPEACAAPLPRAYQWADASAYAPHVERVRKSRGAEMPPDFATNPLMYQGGSDTMLGPRDDILCESEAFGIDFEAEVAVITGDVPMGTAADKTGRHIRLVMLANDVSLRYLAQEELKKGFGFFHAKPSTAFSPVAVTPDALGSAWRGHKLHRPVVSALNGARIGDPDAGADMAFDFAQLVAHAARTRALCAGTIIGSGTVSNADPARGYSCLVEKRMVEKMARGTSQTDFLRFGDRVRIESFGEDGQSLFGAIEQTVRRHTS